MAYCGPRGIPYIHFLGGPAGWSALSRAAALAWLRFDRERCQQCGTHPSTFDESDGGHPHAMHAALIHCRGCEIKAGGDEAFERNVKSYRRGTRVELRPVLAEEVLVDAEGFGDGVVEGDAQRGLVEPDGPQAEGAGPW